VETQIFLCEDCLAITFSFSVSPGKANEQLSHSPPEDGYVRMFLRGRPVTIHIPDKQRESYSIDQKVALPDRKPKLQWVYPSGGEINSQAPLFIVIWHYINMLYN